MVLDSSKHEDTTHTNSISKEIIMKFSALVAALLALALTACGEKPAETPAPAPAAPVAAPAPEAAPATEAAASAPAAEAAASAPAAATPAK
jgi:alpha-beta hydrolase superfamily lysophospholipase